MSEMELMCDRVGILVNGSLKGVHTVKEMISSSNGDFCEYIIRVSDCAHALDALDFISVENKFIEDGGHIRIRLEKDNAEEEIFEVTARIVTRGLRLGTVAPVENKKLEDVFIELTKSGGVQIG
jgi:ABC-type multidrug transport system ATPase subunit